MKKTTATEVIELTQEQREKDFRHEMFIQGLFAGILFGAVYMAIMVSIMEKL